MIYLSDDYLNKYSDTLAYLIGRSYQEGYSFDFIEKNIAYSLAVDELEKSNITLFAFSSMEKVYNDIFPMNDNSYDFDPYDIFGWMGYAYIRLFLSLETTFEALFFLVPIQEMLNLYNLYHEMDINQLINTVKETMKHSLLDIVMKKKKISNKELADKSSISMSTISALRYGNRDINKLEARKLLLLSQALNVKMATLLPNINLSIYK